MQSYEKSAKRIESMCNIIFSSPFLNVVYFVFIPPKVFVWLVDISVDSNLSIEGAKEDRETFPLWPDQRKFLAVVWLLYY